MKNLSFNPIERIPFFLITGFLGSGKTTFLKKIVNQFAGDRKLGIIQNEFAPANVDGIMLQQTDKPFLLLEINKGSVFCVCLLSDFRTSLRRFIEEHKPDSIFLEASGLADPIAIAEFLNDTKFDDVFLAHVWCVVDAQNFHKIKNMAVRVQHQIRVADTVIINKTDLNNNIKDIQEHVKTLNPFCKVLEAKNCNIGVNDIFKFNLSVAEKRKEENASLVSSGRPEINAAVLRTGKRISTENLNRFLDEFGKNTYRLKGYVVLDNGSAIAVQSCFGNHKISKIDNYRAPTEIIAMGKNISAKSLKDAFSCKCVV